VVVGTGSLFATFNLTLDSFIESRMILLLFPAVAHVAVEAYLTSTAVV